MSAGYRHGEVYFRCGSAQTLEPCAMAKQAVRESDLFPTIDAVFGDFLNGIPAARPSVTIETAAVRLMSPTSPTSTAQTIWDRAQRGTARGAGREGFHPAPQSQGRQKGID